MDHPVELLHESSLKVEMFYLKLFLINLKSFISYLSSSLGMMYAPQSVEPQYASTAGMFGAAMLITGIFSGIMFSWIFPVLVANVSW